MSLGLTQGGPDATLLTLLDLAHRARRASTANELAFMLVNDSRALLPYRQSALWFVKGGVRTLSGVVQPDSNTPYVQWLNRVCACLQTTSPAEHAVPRRISAADLNSDPADDKGEDQAANPSNPLIREWAEWLPTHALWLPLPAPERVTHACHGGLLLALDQNASDSELLLLAEWCATWHHAWLALAKPSSPWRLAWLRSHGDDSAATEPLWRRKSVWAALALLVLLCLPVRLTALAPGELVPAHPAVIRAPLDGVIGQIHVQPNQLVKAGDVLFSFDEAPLVTRLEVARQALATAQVEYRQLAQQALAEDRYKAQLSSLIGKIREKQAEADYVAAQVERSRVVAPQDGLALFDDPSEWVGRPVQTGERVMRVANATEAEIEAWLPIADAIVLPPQAPVNLYLTSSPFGAVAGQVRYVGYEAVPRPDGSFAYRLRASLTSATLHRIGLKGTVKIYGERVPLVYLVLRRPLAMLRQLLVY